MYQVIEHPVMMTKEEIIQKYDGYWILVVSSDMNYHGGWTQGIPVVIADGPFRGVEDGIYDKFEDPKYNVQFDMSLIDTSKWNGILTEVRN